MITAARRDDRPPDTVTADEPTTIPAARPPAEPGRLSARVRRPLPTVLVVHPSGALDECTAPALGDHIAGRAGDALHIVLDLTDVVLLSPSGVRALLDLDRLATHRGYVLHLAGTGAHPLLTRLLRAGLLHT